MQKLQHITHLAVDHAQYEAKDAQGNQVIIHVKYAANAYELEQKNPITEARFLDEVNRLAKGLLARKSAKNLAEREQLI